MAQIHDELLFEVKDDKIKQTGKLIKEAMENVVKLNVALTSKVFCGNNWADLEILSL